MRPKVELSRKARKELLNPPRYIAKRIINELRKLQDTPIPKYAIKIRGEKDVYRISHRRRAYR